MSIDDDFFSDAPAPKPTAAGRHVPSRSSSGEGAGAGEESPQLDLLSEFWGDEEGAGGARAEAERREQELMDSFFAESIENPTARRAAEESKSRRVNVGLDPADARLLEELYEQSRRAGLKNVSRARILRVALRHFHTCWLTRAD